MIDRFRITSTNPQLLQLDSRVITHPELYKRAFPCLRIPPAGFRQQTGEHYFEIELLPNKALTLEALCVGKRYFIRFIEGTAPALLYGHNGRPLRDHEDLLLFLNRMKQHLMQVVEPHHHEHIIPGTSDKNATRWSMMELHVQLPDPGGELLQAFQHARHPSIRNSSIVDREPGPLPRKVTGVLLPGKNTKFKIYLKDLQMTEKIKRREVVSDLPVARFELTLKSAVIDDHFPPHCRRLIKGRQRVVAFKFEELKTVFRSFVGRFEGVYRAPEPEKSSWLVNVAARLAEEQGLSIPYMFDVVASEKGLRDSDYIAKQKKDALRRKASFSQLEAATLFTDEAFRCPPVVAVPELEESIHLPPGLAYQDAAILAAYATLQERIAG